MKQSKLFLLGTLMFLTMFSCSEDQSTSIKPETTSVVATLVPSTNTGKVPVNRNGVIPVWVEDITITAVNPLAGPWTKSETYEMKNSGGASNFVLNDVALGINNFTASSTTNVSNRLEQTSVAAQTTTPNNANADLTLFNGISYKGAEPYVLYNASTPNVPITATGANAVNFSMIPQNGRSIALFQLDKNSEPAQYYKAVITAVVTKQGGGTVTLTSTTVNKDNSTIVYWSNSDAITGAKIDYTIQVKTLTDVLVNTFTRSYTIENGKSNSCIYTITNSTVTDNLQKFTFEFKPLIPTENCGLDLEGYDICTKKDNHGHTKDKYDDKNVHKTDGCVHGGDKSPNHKDD
jgi:hypothetical protein